MKRRDLLAGMGFAGYAAATRDGRIESATARCAKSEHLYRIRAKVYVDATGDSRLGLEAGAFLRTGREARSEFGESLTPERADPETLGTRGIVRASQLETVRDYSILATLPDGREETLVTVEGNHQRLNRLRVDPVTARALRVVVTRTNGLPEARIFALRCYSPSA